MKKKIPKRRNSHRGDLGVLDKLGSTKGKEVRSAIRHDGPKLFFLPPYSPALNPIEQAFAKLKHWLRHAQARSIEDIYQSLKGILERFHPHECAAYLQKSGYASTTFGTALGNRCLLVLEERKSAMTTRKQPKPDLKIGRAKA